MNANNAHINLEIISYKISKKSEKKEKKSETSNQPVVRREGGIVRLVDQRVVGNIKLLFAFAPALATLHAVTDDVEIACGSALVQVVTNNVAQTTVWQVNGAAGIAIWDVFDAIIEDVILPGATLDVVARIGAQKMVADQSEATSFADIDAMAPASRTSLVPES